MDTLNLNIAYTSYASLNELEDQDRELAEAAIGAMKGAYAPYSHFIVGAAVRVTNGQIFIGANQENAAYPSGLCAERTAMFAASAHFPQENLKSIAVAAGLHGVITEKPASPCGACRQVMAQYQTKYGQNMSVILVGQKCIYKFEKVDDILPFIFDDI